MVVLDFYIQVQSPGTTGRKWRARSNHTPKKIKVCWEDFLIVAEKSFRATKKKQKYSPLPCTRGGSS